MPRLVRLDATGPLKIVPEGDKPIFVCACGLSRTLPLCDGSHKGCISEEKGVLYVYGDDRRTVIETRPDTA